MKRLLKSTIYLLLFLPLSCLLLLELTLQVASNINLHNFQQISSSSAAGFNSTRIIALGDSNTFGLHLERHQSYPAQLQQALQDQLAVEVVNLGYPGANSSRIVKNFSEIVERIKPDAALIMIGTNDFWTAAIPTDEVDLGVSTLGDWLKKHSRSYKLWSIYTRPNLTDEKHKIVNNATVIGEDGNFLPPKIFIGDTELDFNLAFRSASDTHNADELLQQNISKLITLGEKHNVKVIFLTYPANKGYYRQANKMVTEAIEKAGYPHFLDTRVHFQTMQPEKDQGNQFFFHDLHATAEGNRELVQQITTPLMNLLLASE